MPTKVKPWSSAQHPKTPKDIQPYLDAMLKKGGDHPAHLLHKLGVIARTGNMSQLARKVGITHEDLHEALSEQGDPSFTTVIRIAKALGLQIRFEFAPEAGNPKGLKALLASAPLEGVDLKRNMEPGRELAP